MMKLLSISELWTTYLFSFLWKSIIEHSASGQIVCDMLSNSIHKLICLRGWFSQSNFTILYLMWYHFIYVFMLEMLENMTLYFYGHVLFHLFLTDRFWYCICWSYIKLLLQTQIVVLFHYHTMCPITSWQLKLKYKQNVRFKTCLSHVSWHWTLKIVSNTFNHWSCDNIKNS